MNEATAGDDTVPLPGVEEEGDDEDVPVLLVGVVVVSSFPVVSGDGGAGLGISVDEGEGRMSLLVSLVGVVDGGEASSSNIPFFANMVV